MCTPKKLAGAPTSMPQGPCMYPTASDSCRMETRMLSVGCQVQRSIARFISATFIRSETHSLENAFPALPRMRTSCTEDYQRTSQRNQTDIHAIKEKTCDFCAEPPCLRDHVCTPCLKLNMHSCGSTHVDICNVHPFCNPQFGKRVSSTPNNANILHRRLSTHISEKPDRHTAITAS